MAQNLQKIFDRYRYDSTIQTNSRVWFQQQVSLLSTKRLNEKKLFTEQKVVSKIVPGKLYLFYYDAKYRDELPYFDRFPLVFPYASMPDGFMGLNMHYLPIFHRVQLMTRLMEFSSNKNFNETTRIKYSWHLISGVARFRDAEPCIKHYLKDHVQSGFIEIPGQEWHTAMMLPLERFVGKNKRTIWGDSLKR